jgi:peptide/nickel transport system permease protein
VRALLRLVLSRLVQGTALLLALSLALFVVVDRLPGDPVALAADPDVTAAELARQRALRGRDAPVVVQWARWLWGHAPAVPAPPIVQAPPITGAVRPPVAGDGRRWLPFVVDIAIPPAPPGTRLFPVLPLYERDGRWHAELPEPGATRLFAVIRGLHHPDHSLPGRPHHHAEAAPGVEHRIDGHGVDGHGVDGHRVDGDGVDGPGVDGHRVDGPGVDGHRVDGDGVDGPGVDGPGVDGHRVAGDGVDGPGATDSAAAVDSAAGAPPTPDPFGAQEGVWSLPVYVAPLPAAGDVDAAGVDARSPDALQAAAVTVRALQPVARVAIPRLSGQRVTAEDGDVYVVDGRPLAGPWRCGAVCFLVGDAAALGWSPSTQRPVAELLFGPDGHPCGDGVRDPGEACDDGNADADDGCVACAVPSAGPAGRLDARLAGALVDVGRVGNTLWLTTPALLLSLGLALVLGTLAGRRGGRVDVAVRAFAVVGSSAPTFVVGLGLLALVAVRGRWLPTGGLLSPGIHEAGAVAVVVDRLRHTALPLLVLTLSWTAHLVRPVRSAVVAVGEADFVLAARARGLSPRRILVVHVLPHAALPLVTLAGLSLPSLLGGALLTETLFAWPGLGRLQYDALLQHDQPVVVVVALAIAALVLLGSLLADVSTWLLDPRLRPRSSSSSASSSSSSSSPGSP